VHWNQGLEPPKLQLVSKRSKLTEVAEQG